MLSGFRSLNGVGELRGCDIDAEAIGWGRTHRSTSARFACNPSLPPTSFRNAHFDVVYSVSAFTRLPEELQFAWLT